MTDYVIKNIKYLCKVKGISLGELEKTVGISVGYFSRLYGRADCMSVKTLNAVSTIFDISMDDLVKRPIYKEQRIKELKEELERLENE